MLSILELALETVVDESEECVVRSPLAIACCRSNCRSASRPLSTAEGVMLNFLERAFWTRPDDSDAADGATGLALGIAIGNPVQLQSPSSIGRQSLAEWGFPSNILFGIVYVYL